MVVSRLRDEQDCRLQGNRDDDDVDDGAQPWALPQGDPQQQDQEADHEVREPDAHGRPQGQAFGEHRPRGDAEAGHHQQPVADPEQREPEE